MAFRYANRKFVDSPSIQLNFQWPKFCEPHNDTANKKGSSHAEPISKPSLNILQILCCQFQILRLLTGQEPIFSSRLEKHISTNTQN